MKLHLSIEELVLQTEIPIDVDPERLSAAIEEELGQLLRSEEVPAAPPDGVLRLDELRLELRPGMDLPELGRSIAWQIWGAWSTPTLSPASPEPPPFDGPSDPLGASDAFPPAGDGVGAGREGSFAGSRPGPDTSEPRSPNSEPRSPVPPPPPRRTI